MANLIPPQPVGVTPGHSFWNDWIEKIRNVVNDLSLGLLNHNDLQSIQGGGASERYHLTSSQHTDLTDAGDSALHFHATDRARTNHTGTQTMATISDLPTLAAGTYTPTLTNTTNLDASTAYQAQYLRVGATVTVSGKVDVDPTAAGQVQLGISVPVASNFGATEDLAGCASAIAVAGQCAGIYADTANDRAILEFITTDTSNRIMFFTFSYQII